MQGFDHKTVPRVSKESLYKKYGQERKSTVLDTGKTAVLDDECTVLGEKTVGQDEKTIGEKTMDKVLSVVIPSYNVERFLRQTLDSFLDKRILKDIEVLIVDDGSSDGTGAIGKEYETRYPDSFRLISKKNGGHGSTINRGIEESRGTYFKVVDGDDWVDTEGFVCMVEKLRTCSADYVVCNYYEVDDQTKERTPREFKMLQREQGSGEYWDFSEIVTRTQIPMHSLAIRSAILKEHHIRLDEHCFYVDVEYILYPVPYVEKVAFFDIYVYMYRLAQATQSVSMQGYQKHIQNHIDVIMHLTDFVTEYAKQEGSQKEKIEYISKRIAEMVGEQITIFMSYPVENEEMKQKFIEFDQELLSKNPEIYRLAGQESGTLSLLRRTGFKGYKTIVKMGKKRNGMEG